MRTPLIFIVCLPFCLNLAMAQQETLYFGGAAQVTRYDSRVYYGTFVDSTLRYPDGREIVKYQIYFPPSQLGGLDPVQITATDVTIGVRTDGAEICLIQGYAFFALYPSDASMRNYFRTIAPIQDMQRRSVSITREGDHFVVLIEIL